MADSEASKARAYGRTVNILSQDLRALLFSSSYHSAL